jgi:glycosyltransferase involved in cell wall biosynthesis
MEALGGVARHVIDVVTHADEVEHHVAMPLARSTGEHDLHTAARLQEAGAVLHVLPMERSHVSPHNLTAVARTARLIRSLRADVVHGHSAIGGVVGRLAATATRRPAVYTPNGIHPGWVAHAVEAAVAPLTSCFVAVSESEARRSAQLHLRPRRLVVIPNGVEVDPKPPLEVTDLRAACGGVTGPLVGSIARLDDQKAPLHFVAVAAGVHRRVPEAKFVLIGDGPLAAEFDDAVVAAGLTDVVTRLPVVADAPFAVAHLDVFILCSRYEGAPYAPMEAMRAGVPVVLTDVVGSRDLVVDGETGMLVPFGDNEAHAAAVAALLEDRERADRIGVKGRQTIADHFDIKGIGDALVRLYHEVARR